MKIKAYKKDFDYTYQDDGEIESFLKKQNPFLWMKYWFEQSEYELKRGIVYDEGKLEKKLNNLSHLSEESQEAPVDAKIVYKEDQFVVKKEKQGTTIDTDALGKAVEQALKEGEETLDVEQADGYVKPAVTKDSELLAKQKKQLNELANVQVTYELPEGEKVLNGNTVKAGSTIITFKKKYLNTLSVGIHTCEIVWTDGSASTTFTTKANISDNSNNNQNDNNNSNSSDDKPSSGTDKKDVTAPKTGDNTPSVWLFILSILSGTGLIITVKKRRENLNS